MAAAMRLRASAREIPTLQQYLLQLQVLSLYRRILRTLKDAPPNVRDELKTYARAGFDQHKNVDLKDMDKIKWLLAQGKQEYEMAARYVGREGVMGVN